jgi:hypothetical protein
MNAESGILHSAFRRRRRAPRAPGWADVATMVVGGNRLSAT